MATTDFEDKGGGVQLVFGENAGGTRYPLRVDTTGRIEARSQLELTRVDVTPTITSGTAYAAGDAVGGLMKFEDVVDGEGGHGEIRKVVITDKGAQNAAFDLVIFSGTFTPTANDAELDISDADLLNSLGVISVGSGTYVSFKDNSVATYVCNPPFPFVLGAGVTDLYTQAKTEGTPTYTSTSDIKWHLVIAQHD